MIKTGLLGLLLVVVLGLALPAQTTQAQITCTDYDFNWAMGATTTGWTVITDPDALFAGTNDVSSTGSFTLGTGAIEGGGFDTSHVAVAGEYAITLEEGCMVGEVIATSRMGVGNILGSVGIFYDDGSGLQLYESDFITESFTDFSVELNSNSITSVGVIIYASGESYLSRVQIFTEPDTTPADWIRPLLEEDENTVGGLPMWDQPGLISALFGGPVTDIGMYVAPQTQFRVTAMSNAPGAPVLAAQSGTVTDVKLYSGDMCSIWGVILSLGTQCWFSVPASGLEVMSMYQFPITDNIQQVTIEMADGNELRYLVYNANRYVNLNQEINAGCAIGETIEAAEVPPSQIANIISSIVGDYFNLDGFVVGGTEPGFGITFVEERNPGEAFEMVSLYPKLTAYSTTDIPCNTPANFQDCLLSEPDLTNGPTTWTRLGDVEDTEAGLKLPPNSYIEQNLNLPDETTFTLRVGLYFFLLDVLTFPEATTRDIRLQVGDFVTTETIELSDQYQEIAIEVPTPGADPGGTGYTVRISNISPVGNILVAAACLTTDDHELNPRACYFQNADFDSTAGWVTTNVQQGNGFIILANADAVLQETTLRANEDDSPRTYRLTVDARPIAAPNETLDTNSGSATLYYSWGDVATIGTLDLQWNLPGNPGYPDAYETFSVDIEVVEQTTEDFIIYTGITDNDTVNIALSRACLSTDTETPTGGGAPGPFGTTCSTIPVPTEDSIGVWTMYHWRNLDKFFNCKLMVLLNRWFKLFDDFRLTTLKTFRWGIAFINKAVNWSQSLFWWLNGHFRNIATGQVTTITEGGGCHDFFCAIIDVVTTLANLLNPVVAALNNVVNVLLGIIVGTVNLFFTLIGGLVAFVVALIIKLLSLFQLAAGLLTTIITAYSSATPTAIPGLPMCATDPDSSPLCVMVWATDNTIFSGRWGILFVVLLSIFAIHLIIWAIGEFKEVLIKTWGSS